VTGGWRKLRGDEFNNWYFSLNMIRMMKLRKVKWAGHVEYMGLKRDACRIWVGRQKETDH
jgi:hypothetical protein